MTRKNYNADRCFWFVVDLWEKSGRNLIVVWDNLGAHRNAAEICRRLNLSGLSFEWLPKYAPDLNPVENLWSSTKWASLGNYVPAGLDDLERRVAEELNARARRHRYLQALFRETGLKP